MSTPVTLVGATGLTGHATFLSLLSSPSPIDLLAVTRRALAAPSTAPGVRYANLVVPDFSAVLDGTGSGTGSGEAQPEAGPIARDGGVFVSCLGTTRAQAGGTDKQAEVDLVLNRRLAERAKADGASTYILVSSQGASSSSRLFYPRIKGELEDAARALGFARTVLVRPGMLLGARAGGTRTLEGVVQSLFRGARAVGMPISALAVDADDVGAAIAYVATHSFPEGETILYNAEIIDYANKYRAATGASK
ncbi:Protein fmp52, mitochondrial [Cryptotrichosporon argae]